MNIQTIDKKYILIPAVIIIILVVVVLLLPSKNKTSDTKSGITPSQYILPTRIAQPTKSNSDSRITPTIIPAQNFTGASVDQQLPLEIEKLGIQKTELRRKTPITLPFGTITFDYEVDKFDIALSQPKETSASLFHEWLKQNYSAIPLDRFVEK